MPRNSAVQKVNGLNIFGAFTFGSLIKTFLPGIVWLLALGLLEADIARLRGVAPLISTFVQAKEQAALVLAFPAAILLGLISNIVVFMGINDWLVRNPVKRANPTLFALYEQLVGRIRSQCSETLALDQQQARHDFDTHTDVELIMLAELGTTTLAYVREQYWYHLEFQMNLLLSLVGLFLGVALNTWLGQGAGISLFLNIFLYFLLFFAVGVLLLEAARKNYARHISKMLSLMVGVLCQKEKKASASWSDTRAQTEAEKASLLFMKFLKRVH
jgi:hypothetical protein